MKQMDNNTFYFLLARFIDSELPIKVLADVSVPSFAILSQTLHERFDTLELTNADIKTIWMVWFDWAVFNGKIDKEKLRF